MNEARIPTYKLFGETEIWAVPDPVHHETIAARSALYAWEIRPHSHDNLFQILFVDSGRAEMTLETERQVLPAPCVVTLPPRCVHGFSFSPDTIGHIITLPQFLVRELLALSPGLSLEADCAHIHPLAADAASLARLRYGFETFREEYAASHEGRVTVLMAILAQVLVCLARAGGRVQGHEERERFGQRLGRFHELIDRHFRERRPVSFYADRLGVSTVQLNNTCRRRTGRTAQQLIHDRVLLEARRLLAYSDLDIGQISHALGFRDPSYFSRFFARAQGTAPSDYRLRHGPGPEIGVR